MTFKNLSSTGRSQAVKEQILAAITSGDYAPGDKLPSESELGTTLGVSRVSIREALRSLEAVGLIEIRHGRGSFVAMGPRGRYQSPFAGWLQVHRDEILDLMKVRGALDELAAAEAATKADEPALAAIEDAQERFRIAARDPAAAMDELIDSDVAFHVAIARASGSSLLLDLLEELNKLFEQSRNALFSLDERARRSVREHDAIVKAIRSGSGTKARSAAAHHLESTRRTLTSSDLLQRLAGDGETT
ncbi:FadR/GntR family transcriptional regulator (plasmid) [Pseudonocardia bannensis]|uniref:FadR family transcriptional regulator n=1 Tax=Pseudonocardia bannensis TaxID=630973 RepID=A0A848DM18_9PSEU|nr:MULTISPECIES: FCD domain-containing protein [Pseudonocardia]NMH93762.1 FadR family transcriptional regulator [Pseudonocardia bannensis]